MKKYLIVFTYLLYVLFIKLQANTAITYQQSSGRLGDQLIYYSIARGIAFKHDIEFYAKPFALWDHLLLSQKDKQFNEKNFKGFEHIYIRNEKEFLDYYSSSKNQLFIIDHTHWETSSPDSEWYGVNSSSEFRNFIKSLIKPAYTIPILKLPSNSLNVALHYRTGEGYDDPKFIAMQQNEQSTNPKFRPLGYYLQQIKTLQQIFPNQAIFIYIFTDASNPEKILNIFKSKFINQNIEFSTRKEPISWKKNTLIDLFHMAQFDCLIRPRSSFSFIAQLIGMHQVVLHPKGILYIK